MISKFEGGVIMRFGVMIAIIIFALATLDKRDEKNKRRWDEIDWFFWRKW